MKKIITLWGILLSASLLAAPLTKTGILNTVYGDAFSTNTHPIVRYELITGKTVVPLHASQKFIHSVPVHNCNGKRVEVVIKNSTQSTIQSIKLIANSKQSTKAVTGSQPWASILCKFSDINTEPENLAFFQSLYANQVGGLDHFWRQASYNNINTIGSIAIDWVNLPSPQTSYIPSPGSNHDANLGLLFTDCTNAADSFINFADAGNGSPFAGINMMFNDVLDCCAWGGGKWATLDGITKAWRVTWEPPWGYANQAVLAHEMGHGFGLPHSNNSDGDTNPYDTPWGVMSAATVYSVNHAIHGRLGKHLTMDYKYDLGWVTDADGFIANASSNNTITIDRISIATTTNYRFAKIPLSNGTFYMIEARKKVGDYDANLPGEAIIINHVDNSRNEPPWIVDAANPPADFSDNEGVMWKVGESFTDTIDGYVVDILNTTADGFSIKITGPNATNDLIFANSFD